MALKEEFSKELDKLKRMPSKDRLWYLWTYYKIWLAVFKDFTYLDLLKLVPEFLAGAPLSSEYMTLMTTTRAKIAIVDDHPLSTNMDGDEGPAFPLDLEVLPSFLKVYVPDTPDAARPHAFPLNIPGIP